MSEHDGPGRPEDVGSVGEEAAKLFGALSGWARDHGGDLSDSLGDLAGHATEAVRFRDDHASHRVNVTMLYGDRDLDRHHPPSDATASSALAAPWRSAAFSRGRRRS